MENDIIRNEYPRPQFVRDLWQNLNGKWEFAFDDNDRGEKEQWFLDKEFEHEIIVPFCYQSELSGIEDNKQHHIIWYKREFELAEDFVDKRVFLNFEAVDYKTRLWVNGKFVGEHKGGHVPFKFDITNHLKEANNKIVVRVEDKNKCNQPIGKQSWKDDNFLCWYTRTTGIWQTVWLEAVDDFHLTEVKMTPDIDQGQLEIEAYTSDYYQAGLLEVEISFQGELIKKISTNIKESKTNLSVDVSSKSSNFRLEYWSPENPRLYDIKFRLKDKGKIKDEVDSYFGMRKISLKENGKILLNNKEYYQKLILDQGYYNQGLMTATSDQDFINDIKKIKAMGFNGVRKHQKIEDRRFMYWCDKLGLLMWAEMPSAFEFDDRAINNFIAENQKMIKKHYNHPSVITWVLLNESWGVNEIYSNSKQQSFSDALYHLTKALDDSRPVISNDGWEHTTSDILTIHDYVEDADTFKEKYKDKTKVVNGSPSITSRKENYSQGYSYDNQPIMISEYGGIAFDASNNKQEDSWGYGDDVSDKEEFLERFKKLTHAIMDLDYIFGFCYTQLTDVEQEINGLLDEKHNLKFASEKIKEILNYKYDYQNSLDV